MGTALEIEASSQWACFHAHKSRSGSLLSAAVSALFFISGCASSTGSMPDFAGRPLVYKVGPGDPPSTIHTKAGIVYKERVSSDSAPSSAQQPVQIARAESPAPPAPAPSTIAPAPSTAPATTAPAPTNAAPPVAPATSAAAAPAAGALGSSVLDARYTQATRYGDLLFLSGQIAIDLVTGEPIADLSIEAQTRKVMENIQRILEVHGLTMANVLSTQVYLRTINNLTPMDAAYRKFFKTMAPARTVVEVSNLPRGMEVQISAVAGK